MKKRVFSLVLAFSLCCSLLAIPASAYSSSGNVGYSECLDRASFSNWKNAMDNCYYRSSLDLYGSRVGGNRYSYFDSLVSTCGVGEVGTYHDLEVICEQANKIFYSPGETNSVIKNLCDRFGIVEWLVEFIQPIPIQIFLTGSAGFPHTCFTITYDSYNDCYRIVNNETVDFLVNSRGQYACYVDSSGSSDNVTSSYQWVGDRTVSSQVMNGTVHLVPRYQLDFLLDHCKSDGNSCTFQKLGSDKYVGIMNTSRQFACSAADGLVFVAPAESNQWVSQEDERDYVDTEYLWDLLNNYFVTPDGDTQNVYDVTYDNSDRSYTVETYNYDYETNEYTYNSWDISYYTNYTYVYNIGQTSQLEQYELYYQLPDGRSSAELTKEELEQLNLNIDVINYQAVADTSTLRALWHLDGNLSDSSYYSSLNKVKWGNGSSNIASITYMDVAQFGGALYLGNTNDYDVSFILSRYSPSGDFTVEFRLYQSAINSSSAVANSLRLNVCGVDVLTSDGVTFTDFSGSTFNCPTGQWNHYVFQYESASGKMVFCLNGSLRSYATVSLSGLSSFHALDLYIKNGCGSYYMLDEVRVSDDSIYPSTFSPSQVPFDTNLTLVLPDVEDDNGAPVLLSASSLGDMVDASELENSPAYSSLSAIDNQALVTQDGEDMALVPLMATIPYSAPDAYYYFYVSGVSDDTPFTLTLLDSLDAPGSFTLYDSSVKDGATYKRLIYSYAPNEGQFFSILLSPSHKCYVSTKSLSFELSCNGVTHTVSSSDYSTVLATAFSNPETLDFSGSVTPPAPSVGGLRIQTVNNGGNQSDSFSYTVTLSDTSISGTYGDASFTNGVANLSITSGSSKTITGLPAGATYTVSQVLNSSYSTTNSGSSGTITADSTKTCTFTNTYIPPSPSVGGLRIQTVNNGGNQSDSFSYTVTLSDTSISGTYGLAIFSNGVGNISIASGSYADITGLPAGITYSVAQTENSSYTTTSSGASGIITADEQAQAIFTNTYIPPVIPDEPDEPHPSVPQTVEHPILAVKTQIPVTDYQIGGVRPVYPSKGLVYALVESGYITSVQIYTGYAWEGVDARIWTGSRWIPYSYLNVITLNDMYDIVDASGQSGYEYIYTDTGFWAWLQKWLIQFKTDLFEKLGSGSSESINISDVNNIFDVDIDVDSETDNWDFDNSNYTIVTFFTELPKVAFNGATGLIKTTGNFLKNVPLALDTFYKIGNPLNPAGAFKVFIIPGT